MKNPCLTLTIVVLYGQGFIFPNVAMQNHNSPPRNDPDVWGGSLKPLRRLGTYP